MKKIIASAHPTKKGVKVSIAPYADAVTEVYEYRGVDVKCNVVTGRLATRREKIERGYPLSR